VIVGEEASAKGICHLAHMVISVDFLRCELTPYLFRAEGQFARASSVVMPIGGRKLCCHLRVSLRSQRCPSVHMEPTSVDPRDSG
jgi:hypothetical protein